MAVRYDHLDAHIDTFPNGQPHGIGYAVTDVKSHRVRLTHPNIHTHPHPDANRNATPNQHAHADGNRDTLPNQYTHANSDTHRNLDGHSNAYPYRDVYPFTNGYANRNAGLLRTRRFRRWPTEQLAAARSGGILVLGLA